VGYRAWLRRTTGGQAPLSFDQEKGIAFAFAFRAPVLASKLDKGLG